MADRIVAVPSSTEGRRSTVLDLDPLKGGDIHQWAMDQAALLRAGRFDQVDLSNIADEIEDVGRSDYRTLESRIEVVLTHMLKWDHQAFRRSLVVQLDLRKPAADRKIAAAEPELEAAIGRRDRLRIFRQSQAGRTRDGTPLVAIRRNLFLHVVRDHGRALRVRQVVI